jgi:MoaA/NifB/PqqE/SkfB family radical SAM enzyme
MKSLVITNGSSSIQKYQKLFDLGLNHLQVSMHALGGTLDRISSVKGAGERQMELLEWMSDNEYLFRVNITLQRLNYQEVYDVVTRAVELGAFHVSLLNFLPHFGWKNQAREVAVDPAHLVEMLEKAMTWMEKQDVLFSLRYFPACMVKPRFWKYISNAIFVLFDPWEWEYGHLSKDIDKIWEASSKSVRKTGIKGKPCSDCRLIVHCGGWNKFYASAFDYKGLKPIKRFAAKYGEALTERGGLFDMNPANSSKGYVD